MWFVIGSQIFFTVYISIQLYTFDWITEIDVNTKCEQSYCGSAVLLQIRLQGF